MDDFRRDDKNRRGAEPAKSMAAIRMVVWATIGLVFLTTAAVAQIERKPIAPEDLQKIQDSNAKCLECHSEASFDALDRPNVDKEKLRAHLVDPSVYEDSNHGRVECLACHVKGFKETPHVEKDKQQINWCDECHTRKFLRIEMQFDESVHAKDGIKDKFTCSTCHDPHVFQHEMYLSSPRKAVQQDNTMCLQCHDSEERFALMTKEARPDLAAKHEWLPNNPLHWAAVRCVECHTPAPKKVLSHEIVNAEKAEKNCVACHSADSTLRVRLYRHLVKEERNEVGFINSVILNEAYVIGATRNLYLDKAFGIVAALVIGGISLHSLLRIISGLWRRRRND